MHTRDNYSSERDASESYGGLQPSPHRVWVNRVEREEKHMTKRKPKGGGKPGC